MGTDTAIRFHLSINVADLAKSAAFYESLFGQPPAKRRDDYAKFELNDPPLVMSLEPGARPVGGPLNHVGFRFPDSKPLVAMQERLERAGFPCNREEGVECCYARQTKFWITDPDGTLWEFYTLEGDIEHRGAGQDIEAMLPSGGATALALMTTWEHRMGQPIPETLAFPDRSVDQVSLRGTFNEPVAEPQRRQLLAEARRVLKPGGRLFVHVLTAEKALPGEPGLPGPAAKVSHVPLDREPEEFLKEGGLSRIRRIKYDEKPCFVRHGIAMRETQVEAFSD